MSRPLDPLRAMQDPHSLARLLARDQLTRLVIVLGVPAALLIVGRRYLALDALPGLLALGVGLGWLVLSMLNARIWQGVLQLGPDLHHDAAQVEAHLAATLKVRGLHRAVRVMLGHRLALLRHQQSRFAESAAIAQSLLCQPLGQAEQVRPHLLLMLAEARLMLGDLWGAYLALHELSQRPLRLVEALQRAGLMTRYLVEAGFDEVALYDVERTVRLAELMPAAQCGAIHAMLATAAGRSGQSALGRWLRARAELLCDPRQWEQLVGNAGFSRLDLSPGELSMLSHTPAAEKPD